MDNKNYIVCLEEAIDIELNVAELYRLFYEHSKEDYSFWFELSVEELNHAALIKSLRNFYKTAIYPHDLIPKSIQMLKQANKKINDYKTKFIKNPSREYAFKIAIDIENSAGEIHYQNFMTSNKTDKISELFRKLNLDDIDHARRIEEYRIKNNIKI